MTSHQLLPISLLLLLLTAQYTSASVQPPFSSIHYDIDDLTDEDGHHHDIYTHKLDVATLVVAVIFMVGFLILALSSVACSRLSSDAGPQLPVSTSCEELRSGLDPAAIDAFPILTYSDATALTIGKETLECAICLSDFTKGELLQMLPNCCHVFHPECVGSWLECHVTCPVCRDNLAEVPTEKSRSRRRREHWSLDLDLNLELDLGRIGRSQSMGEITRKDRHRLVLPEHVMKELVEAGELRRWRDVAVIKDRENARRGFRGLSDRWTAVILSRVFSKGEKDGVGDGCGKNIEEGSCSDDGGSTVTTVKVV